MNYNMAVVMRIIRDGSSQAMAVDQVVGSLVATGIDFANLGQTQLTFENGRYVLSTGHNPSPTFELYTKDDRGTLQAGGLITDSIYDINSWVRNINVELDTSVVPPRPSVRWDPGPLAALVDGDVNVDSNSLQASLKLRADAIEIKITSENLYTFGQIDTSSLRLKMTSNQVALSAFAGDLEAAGVGFSYDGTVFEVPGDGLAKQEFFGSNFTTKRLDNGNYVWEGIYQSRVERDGVVLFQSGLATNLGGNYTDYFCDMDSTRRIGRAKHDDSLLFGIFDFDGPQQDFPYILL